MPVLLFTIEHMGEDIQQRLRRLGVVRGARNLKPASIKPAVSHFDRNDREELGLEEAQHVGEDVSLERLLPGGRLVETQYGACFVLDTVYSIDHQHGNKRLSDLERQPMDAAATFCADPRLARLAPHDFLFLDTETTGLGGAGVIAFMVGVAFFDGDAFVVRQYFLREHGDEASMLQMLAELLAYKAGLITFNGRAFDLTLLDNRYLMQRMEDLVDDLLTRPHIDLIQPSRRLWHRRLQSWSLITVEQKLLDVHRTAEDVPGWAIPRIYFDYLISGDARTLLPIFYHNRQDLLSMVGLAGKVTRQFAQPRADDHPLDLLSLARWQLALGLKAGAEDTLRLAASIPKGGRSPAVDDRRYVGDEHLHHILYDLAGLLKRTGRRDEALEHWRQITAISLTDPEARSILLDAHVELAKHYEWRPHDLTAARDWTKRALMLLDSWDDDQSLAVRGELEHRLARLERKIQASDEK